MIGLKSYLPKLEVFTGLTAEMLYERQRKLVARGSLEASPGRGPGSGVRADANSLSTFLISLLAHDLLVEAFMVDPIGWMKSTQARCPFTGKTSLKDALEAILNSQKLAERVELVSVNRNAQTGFIDYLSKRVGTSRQILRSEFANKGLMKFVPLAPSGMETIKSLRPNLIKQIADDIASFKRSET